MRKINLFITVSLISLFCTVIITSCGGKSGGSGSSLRTEDTLSEYEKKEKEKGAKIEGAAGMSDFDFEVIADKPKKDSEKKPAGSPSAKKKTSGKSGDKADKSGDDSSLSYEKKSADHVVSGLKAGFADDNKQFNYYINFIEKYKSQVQFYPINIEERIILRLKESGGKSVPNAKVEIFSGNKLVETGKTYADGSFLFYPSEYEKGFKNYKASFTAFGKTIDYSFDRQGKREHEVKFNTQRQEYKNVPLDILFIFDTTGSMGEEIARLKKTLEIINLNIASLPAKPEVRFGMVLYRDRGDAYVTKVVQLTSDLNKFQKELNNVEAGGGGDGPEDLQSALDDAINKIKWNKDGIRLGFIITDAESHLDYGQKFTYAHAAHEAKKMGIKFFSIGTGGLPLTGEFILRQIAQYTYARYIFLTYGEKGESGGGKEGSVSHHTGANFQTDKLESIIIRFAREEIAYLTDKPLEEGEAFFDAKKIDDEKNEETLGKLFDMAINQLVDYSAISLAKGESAAVLPIKSSNKILFQNSEYFTEQLSMSLGKSKAFKQVERRNMQAIIKELELNQTGIIDEAKAAKAGKMIGANMLIVGTLYKKEKNYELFLKLVRVESAEVLSVTKAIIDSKLGIGETVKKDAPVKKSEPAGKGKKVRKK